MAGDWIPMRVDLVDDPAVIMIADRIGVNEDAVVGKLHRLWSWANRQLSNGHAASVTKMWLDRYLSSSGFADAMIETGWLVEKNGIVSFSKFDRWNSQGAKRRLNAAKRQQNKRFNGHALVTKMSRSKRDENVTREEKRREEKKEEKNTPLPPTAELAVIEKFNPLTAPLPFDSPGFRLAWGEWVEYRRVRKPALTESSVLKQLKHLAELAEPDAIRCIENSIANQWQGLFPEKHAAKPNSRPASRGESQDAYAARLAATAFGGST